VRTSCCVNRAFTTSANTAMTPIAKTMPMNKVVARVTRQMIFLICSLVIVDVLNGHAEPWSVKHKC
jgi:hypothetical protein